MCVVFDYSTAVMGLFYKQLAFRLVGLGCHENITTPSIYWSLRYPRRIIICGSVFGCSFKLSKGNSIDLEPSVSDFSDEVYDCMTI